MTTSISRNSQWYSLQPATVILSSYTDRTIMTMSNLKSFNDREKQFGSDKPVSYQQQQICEVTCITSSVCHFWWLKWLSGGCVVTEITGGGDTDVNGTRAPVVLVMSLTTFLFSSACSIWFSSTTSNSRHFNLSMSACKHQSLALNISAVALRQTSYLPNTSSMYTISTAIKCHR